MIASLEIMNMGSLQEPPCRNFEVVYGITWLKDHQIMPLMHQKQALLPVWGLYGP